MKKLKVRPFEEGSEVERLRQVRAEIWNEFKSMDKFCAYIAELEKKNAGKRKFVDLSKQWKERAEKRKGSASAKKRAAAKAKKPAGKASTGTGKAKSRSTSK